MNSPNCSWYFLVLVLAERTLTSDNSGKLKNAVEYGPSRHRNEAIASRFPYLALFFNRPETCLRR